MATDIHTTPTHQTSKLEKFSLGYEYNVGWVAAKKTAQKISK